MIHPSSPSWIPSSIPTPAKSGNPPYPEAKHPAQQDRKDHKDLLAYKERRVPREQPGHKGQRGCKVPLVRRAPKGQRGCKAPLVRRALKELLGCKAPLARRAPKDQRGCKA